MPVLGSDHSGRISTISQSMPARLSPAPSVMPDMPPPTISTRFAADMAAPCGGAVVAECRAVSLYSV